MGSTNTPKVAASTDIPPMAHGRRRQAPDTPPENCREQGGRYAMPGRGTERERGQAKHSKYGSGSQSQGPAALFPGVLPAAELPGRANRRASRPPRKCATGCGFSPTSAAPSSPSCWKRSPVASSRKPSVSSVPPRRPLSSASSTPCSSDRSLARNGPRHRPVAVGPCRGAAGHECGQAHGIPAVRGERSVHRRARGGCDGPESRGLAGGSRGCDRLARGEDEGAARGPVAGTRAVRGDRHHSAEPI